MKKTIIPFVTLLLFSAGSFAQFTLQGGQAPFYQLVKQPYFYYDLMRYQHKAWIREYRENESQAWGNSNLLINHKDANGNFTYLEYKLWNWNTMSWQINNKFVTERVMNGNDLVEETRHEWVTDTENNLHFFSTESDILYKNNRLDRIDRTMLSEGGQSTSNSVYFKYDGQNRRVHDSEAVSGFSWENRYVYNNNSQCIENYLVFAEDTISLTTYGYTGQVLTRYSSWNYINAPVLQYEELYEYDNEGRITQATFHGPEMDSVVYKHGYDNEDRLRWMCSYYYEDGQWNKSDSVAITYTGNKADTSYGYVSDDLLTWNNWPSFRFLFDEDRVGIDNPEATLDFSVYPNPAKSRISIRTKNNTALTQVSLSDLAGRKMMEYVPLPSGEIELGSISPGIYLLHVQSKQQSGVKKIVIQ